MKKIIPFLLVSLLSLFFVPQTNAALLISQPTVSSGDSWTVNYNNGHTLEFDMNYTGQWPVVICKSSPVGSVSVLFRGNQIFVQTSSGYSKFLGSTVSPSTQHYKIICNNDIVVVYINGEYLGSGSDSSMNVFPSNFVNQPRVDFIANGFTQMTNFTISDSNLNQAPVVTSLTVPNTTQLQDMPVDISATFTDIEQFDTHNATVSWGDGVQTQGIVTENNGVGKVVGSHTYSQGGDYTIRVTITDQNGASVAESDQLHVNLSPIIFLINATGDSSTTYTGIGSFSDDSTSWTGTVDYGDGSGTQDLVINEQNQTFTLNHTYGSAGNYTITVVLIDNHAESSLPFPFSSKVLVTQTTVHSGNNWNVSYIGGHIFEFDMNYTGQWPVLTCKNSPAGNVSVWFQGTQAYVRTLSGFEQLLGGISPNSTQHYKVVCDNNSVSVYVNGDLLGTATDSSMNAFPSNFVNQPRFDFVANGFTRVNNFTIINANLAPVIAQINNATVNKNSFYTVNGSFTDPDSTSWTVTVDYGEGAGLEELPLNPDKTFSLSHQYNIPGEYTVTVVVTDDGMATGTTVATILVTEEVRQLTEIEPAKVLIGIQNILSIGVLFDVKAEVYKGDTVVSSGQMNSFYPGITGLFATANVATIPFNSFAPVDFPEGSELKMKLSVRNACRGSLRRNGVARLWYNDASARSRFAMEIGGEEKNYFLREEIVLVGAAGSAKKSIDVPVGKKCGEFKPFGTWTVTY